MKIPKGIEGDYIETKKSNLFFDVKGLHHPNDRKICFIRFYPHPNGDRIKDERRYKKIYDLQERFSYLRRNYPKYLFFSEQFDTELQCVKNKEIKKIYTPRDYYEELSNKSITNHLEKCSKELCELFIQKSNIPKGSIGITGSQMIELSNDQSDIDIIIYGTEISLDFQTNLKKILSNDNYCRKYNSEEYLTHYQWRVGGSDIPYNKFLESERRKLHQGKFKRYDFYIRYLKSPNDWKGNYYDYSYKNLGRITIEAKIIDDTDKIFTPCSYKIEALKIKNSDKNTSKINLNEIIKIESYRGRFCEQATKGEVVLVEGKLEKVIYKNYERYLRILLTDQIKDKMLILTKKNT